MIAQLHRHFTHQVALAATLRRFIETFVTTVSPMRDFAAN
jgi:hypothetical protein